MTLWSLVSVLLLTVHIYFLPKNDSEFSVKFTEYFVWQCPNHSSMVSTILCDCPRRFASICDVHLKEEKKCELCQIFSTNEANSYPRRQ